MNAERGMKDKIYSVNRSAFIVHRSTFIVSVAALTYLFKR